MLEWRSIGPVRGGRSIAAAGSDERPYQYYSGATGGGLWKTADSGLTWRPVTDGTVAGASVGAIAVAASNPDFVHTGMGEGRLRANVLQGDDLYRSADGGATGQHAGLAQSRTITTIRVHPQDSDLVYVAALGDTFQANEQRGVFRSRAGRTSWEKLLYRSSEAGAIDMAMGPDDPDTPYATSVSAAGEGALEFGVAYTSEFWRNTSGGLVQDTAYLDNLDVTLDVDAEALWGVPDSRVFVYGLYNNGRTLSEDKSGDLQVISNIETGVEAVRLYEAWVERQIADRGSVRFGLYDLNSEFDVLCASGLFINSAHGIGTDFGQTGRNGPSIFPFTSLAMRFDWRWADDWRTRLAVLDGVPGDGDDPGATAIQLGGGDGFLLAAELEWSRAGHRLLAGAWSYTADFEEWGSGAVAAPSRSDGNTGVYLRGETARGDNGNVRLFARLGIADQRYNVVDTFLGAGVDWVGPLPGRPEDRFGVALAWAGTSDDYRDSRAFADRRELALELTYRASLNERITVQPDVQYVVNPGLEPALDDALAVGLRLEVQVL